MNFRVIKQLYKKEMLDVLRDKKTVIMMLIVPILIYPLMFVGGMAMMSKVTTQMDEQTYEIAVDFMDTNPELVQMFLHPDDDTLHFKLEDLNVMNADISIILRGEKINAIVYENEDGTGSISTYEGMFLKPGLFHTTYYGKNKNYWKGWFSKITCKLYEMYYDGNIK